MDSATRVQIVDEASYVSFCANALFWRSCEYRVLLRYHYSLVYSDPFKISYVGHTGLFKNHSYPIGPRAKKTTTTQKCKYERKMKSIP